MIIIIQLAQIWLSCDSCGKVVICCISASIARLSYNKGSIMILCPRQLMNLEFVTKEKSIKLL